MTDKTLSLYKFFAKFPTEKSAREHFEKERWANNILCPYCNSNSISKCKNHIPMPSDANLVGNILVLGQIQYYQNQNYPYKNGC